MFAHGRRYNFFVGGVKVTTTKNVQLKTENCWKEAYKQFHCLYNDTIVYKQVYKQLRYLFWFDLRGEIGVEVSKN